MNENVRHRTDGKVKDMLSYTMSKITEANLSIFVYRLFREVFTPLIRTFFLSTGCFMKFSLRSSGLPDECPDERSENFMKQPVDKKKVLMSGVKTSRNSL